jgi:hypothetical protein
MTEMPMQQGNYDLDFGGSFLKDLPPSIKRYTYHGESQFFDILESESDYFRASPNASEFLLFHACKETLETLVDLDNEFNSPIAGYLTAFDTDEQLFLVRVESMPHGVAPSAMHDAVMQTAQQMGLSNSLKGNSGLSIRGESRGKVADYAWGPKRSARGRRRSPSVVLEVAYSENDTKLNSDMRFWLHPEDGKAEVCLTLRIDRSQPEIRIERWEIQNNRPHRSQVIQITKRGKRTKVTDHPLIIPFEVLFHRPSSCPQEKDLEISQQLLKEVAESIWEEQDW